jgi:hypothetical protein
VGAGSRSQEKLGIFHGLTRVCPNALRELRCILSQSPNDSSCRAARQATSPSSLPAILEFCPPPFNGRACPKCSDSLQMIGVAGPAAPAYQHQRLHRVERVRLEPRIASALYWGSFLIPSRIRPAIVRIAPVLVALLPSSQEVKRRVDGKMFGARAAPGRSLSERSLMLRSTCQGTLENRQGPSLPGRWIVLSAPSSTADRFP